MIIDNEENSVTNIVVSEFRYKTLWQNFISYLCPVNSNLIYWLIIVIDIFQNSRCKYQFPNIKYIIQYNYPVCCICIDIKWSVLSLWLPSKDKNPLEIVDNEIVEWDNIEEIR